MSADAIAGQPDRLPFTVIGGYLGAGKTTLVRDHDGETLELSNGCICCSLVNGFAEAIGQMYQLPLDGILVVVDAEQVRAQADNKYVGDAVLHQLAQADLLVLNTTDLFSPDTLAGLRGWLAGLAPGTPLIETVGSQVPPTVLLGAHHGRTRASADTGAPDDAGLDHAHAYQTWTLDCPTPLPRQALEGFVCLREDHKRRYVYQQVGARWSLEPGEAWGMEPRATRVVVIGRAGATSAESLEDLLGTTGLRGIPLTTGRQRQRATNT